jgi:hypothetical protein
MQQLKYYIFLDDERVPWNVTWRDIRRDYHYNIIRSYEEFTGMIETLGYLPDYISFDHDLADQHYGHGLNNDEIPYDRYNEKTGYDCAKWLVNYCIDNGLKFPDYDVHSMNPVGRTNIIQYVENAKAKVGI